MEVVRVGEEAPAALCDQGVLENGWLFCEAGHTFWLNTKNGRYQIVGAPAYVAVGTAFATDADAADSWMEIGTCSEMK